MRASLRGSALVLASVLLLTGCVGGQIPSSTVPSSTVPSASQDPVTPSAPAEPEVIPASGPIVVGDGYFFIVPEGWQQVDASIAPGADVLAIAPEEGGDFTTNINVVISPAGLVSLGVIEAATKREVEQVGATGVVTQPRLHLGGNEFTRLTAGMTLEGLSYLVEQFGVNSEVQSYLITFSFPIGTPENERVELAQSVLVTWSFD